MSVWPTGEIFFCEGTFERLFLGAIFGTNAPHFIAGWRADFKDQVSNRNNLCAGGINRRLVIIICKADFSLTLLVPFTVILYFFLPRTRIVERWSIIWSMRLDVSYRFPWSWMNDNRCSRCGSCPSNSSLTLTDSWKEALLQVQTHLVISFIDLSALSTSPLNRAERHRHSVSLCKHQLQIFCSFCWGKWKGSWNGMVTFQLNRTVKQKHFNC